MQDRDGAPAVILGAPNKASHVKKIWANCEYRGRKLASALKKLGLGPNPEIDNKPENISRFTVLYRR